VSLTIEILGVAAALAAAVAAIGAWVAARYSARATAALTAIEQRRLHAELTPVFELSCQPAGGDRAELRVAFVGPPGLDRLDQVTVMIRDDIRGRKAVTAGGPTAEEIAAQVWGPYRFVPGVDGADKSGRGVEPVSLMLGDWRPFSLERTRPPTWSNDDAKWRRQYADQPVRLEITCQRDGYSPWVIPLEVSIG
jgi:hypothetical protein